MASLGASGMGGLGLGQCDHVVLSFCLYDLECPLCLELCLSYRNTAGYLVLEERRWSAVITRVTPIAIEMGMPTRHMTTAMVFGVIGVSTLRLTVIRSVGPFLWVWTVVAS